MDDLLGNCSCVALTTYIPVGVPNVDTGHFSHKNRLGPTSARYGRHGWRKCRFCRSKNRSAPNGTKLRGIAQKIHDLSMMWGKYSANPSHLNSIG